MHTIYLRWPYFFHPVFFVFFIHEVADIHERPVSIRLQEEHYCPVGAVILMRVFVFKSINTLMKISFIIEALRVLWHVHAYGVEIADGFDELFPCLIQSSKEAYLAGIVVLLVSCKRI